MLKKYLADLIVGSVKSKKRRYISKSLGVEGFFDKLNSCSVDYCVLRWFETLPNIKDGEDIDMLVADEHVDLISTLFDGSARNGIPCDVYSVSGLPGSDFRGVAYYPPQLAEELLKNTVLYKDKFKIPSSYYHFLSLVYHCLFHKGYDSGLPVDSATAYDSVVKSDHEYDEVIKKLSNVISEDVTDYSLEGLYQFLSKKRWVPSLDTLEKLAYKNKWIKDKFFSNLESDDIPKGIVTFVVRERGVDLIPEIKRLIIREGFEIISEGFLDGAARESFTREVRGGNWHKGPWDVSGGVPIYIIVAIDVFPIAPSPIKTLQNFTLDNERVVAIKDRVRTLYNSTVLPGFRANILHSSDNSAQALYYAELARFDLDILLKEALNLIESVALPWKEVRQLSGHSRRALVRVVNVDGTDYVSKTFRTGCRAYMSSEILVSKALVDCEGALLFDRIVDNHILYPIVSLNRNQSLNSKDIYKIICFVRCASFKGVQLVDFKPSNVLKDECGNLNYIDFEFSIVTSRGFPLRDCYCFNSYPKGIDLPSGAAALVDNYNKYWLPVFMVPKFVVLNASNFYSFFIIRAVFLPFYWIYYRVFRVMLSFGAFYYNKIKRLISKVRRLIRWMI